MLETDVAVVEAVLVVEVAVVVEVALVAEAALVTGGVVLATPVLSGKRVKFWCELRIVRRTRTYVPAVSTPSLLMISELRSSFASTYFPPEV